MRKLGTYQFKIMDTIPEEGVSLQELLRTNVRFVHRAGTLGGSFDWSGCARTINRLEELGLIEVSHRGRSDSFVRRIN